MDRHEIDLLSLLPGLAYLAVAAAALAGLLTPELFAADWLWPAVIIALGVGMLLTLFGQRRDRDADRGGSDHVDRDPTAGEADDPDAGAAPSVR